MDINKMIALQYDELRALYRKVVKSVAIPTGITSIIWINMCKGNFPLGLSIILIDTLLAPLILPAVLYFLWVKQY